MEWVCDRLSGEMREYSRDNAIYRPMSAGREGNFRDHARHGVEWGQGREIFQQARHVRVGKGVCQLCHYWLKFQNSKIFYISEIIIFCKFVLFFKFLKFKNFKNFKTYKKFKLTRGATTIRNRVIVIEWRSVLSLPIKLRWECMLPQLWKFTWTQIKWINAKPICSKSLHAGQECFRINCLLQELWALNDRKRNIYHATNIDLPLKYDPRTSGMVL